MALRKPLVVINGGLQELPTGDTISGWIRKTANYAAVAGDKIYADTTGGGFTITLPANPVSGDSVSFKSGPAAATNLFSVDPGAQAIMTTPAGEIMTVSTNNAEFTLAFDGIAWRL